MQLGEMMALFRLVSSRFGGWCVTSGPGLGKMKQTTRIPSDVDEKKNGKR